MIDSEDERVAEQTLEKKNNFDLDITKAQADTYYMIAGTEVDEAPDQISISKYQHLLNDNVHTKIMEVLEDTQLKFKLADFQLVSLHVLGSKRSLVLVAPTGSGKMLIILLGTLLMRKVFGIENGVSVGTQPLSILMEEKMNDRLVPTAVLSMQGKLKRISDDESEASLSSPEDEVLRGLFPVLLGHPESWACDQEKLKN